MILLLTTLVVAASHVSGHEVGGLTFEVQDNERFCFYERFRNASVYILEYKVLKGGNLDIDVEVTSPRGKSLYSESRRQRDSIPLEVSVGIFTFCFGNEFSSLTHKVVHFVVRPSETDARALAREVHHNVVVRPGVNTMVEQMMESVHDYANKIMHYQTVYRQNEAQGRYVAETLNFHVSWWSTAQTLIIVFTGIGQIFVLKRFFTDRQQRAHVADGNNMSHTAYFPMRP